MRLLERWLSELSPLQRILDLGCGAGSLRTQLAGMNVTGVDIDPEGARAQRPEGAPTQSRSVQCMRREPQSALRQPDFRLGHLPPQPRALPRRPSCPLRNPPRAEAGGPAVRVGSRWQELQRSSIPAAAVWWRPLSAFQFRKRGGRDRIRHGAAPGRMEGAFHLVHFCGQAEFCAGAARPAAWSAAEENAVARPPAYLVFRRHTTLPQPRQPARGSLLRCKALALRLGLGIRS